LKIKDLSRNITIIKLKSLTPEIQFHDTDREDDLPENLNRE